MIAVVEQCNVLWPQFGWKRIQPLHLGCPAAVAEKAERLGNDQRIVDLALVHVWLTDDDQRRARLASKQGFHSRQGDRLIMGEHSALPVAGGK